MYRRSAVATVGEEESPGCGGRHHARAGREGDGQRYSRQRAEWRWLRRQGSERRVRWPHGVPELFDDAEASAIASRVPQRQTAGRHDHGVRVERLPSLPVDPPSASRRREPCRHAVHQERDAPVSCERLQPIPHVPGMLSDREELPRFRFFDEREADLVFEEGDLLPQRPRADNLAEHVRRESVTNRDSSIRAGRILHRPPPLMRILRPPSGVRFEEHRIGACGRRSDGRHRSGCAGTDDDDPAKGTPTTRRYGSWSMPPSVILTREDNTRFARRNPRKWQDGCRALSRLGVDRPASQPGR